MKISEVSKKNGISVLDTVKYDLSIGKESYAVGKISYNLVDKICNCFEEYLRIMKSYGVDAVSYTHLFNDRSVVDTTALV